MKFLKKLFGGGSRKSGQQVTTTQTQLPSELQGLAKQYADRAGRIGTMPFQRFGGQRFADLNNFQNIGLGRMFERGRQGSPVNRAAQGALMGLMQPGDKNPWLDGMVNTAQQSVARNFNSLVKPQLESSMVRSGSFGNSGLGQMMREQQDDTGRRMGDIATQMYGQAYDSDRNRQLQAIGMAPQFAQQDYLDIEAMMRAGDRFQNHRQQQLDFNYDEFMRRYEHPFKTLNAMGQPFGANMGNSTTQTTSQPRGSRIGGGLGGALSGFALTRNPWGAAIGGLAGLFG